MEDYTVFRLPSNHIIEDLYGLNFFEDYMVIYKFIFAYAIKYHFDEIDPEFEYTFAGDFKTYNVGSFNDETINLFLMNVYPDCHTPNRYLKNIITYGLIKLTEKLNGKINIEMSDIL